MRKIFFALAAAFVFSQTAFSLRAAHPALRVVSVTPATTEILFALGLDEEIVAVSSFCNYPPKALTKEKVGTFSYANVEKILSLRPDLVLCTGLEQAPLVTALSHLGLKVYVCDPENFSELFRSILEIGRLVRREREALGLVASMRASIKKVTDEADRRLSGKRPMVFVEIWHDPLTSAGRGSFLDELITLAGGTNIAKDMPRPYGYFSQEEVLNRNPDVILLAYMTPSNPASLLKTRFGWSRISAVAHKRVYSEIDPDILLRPGPRLVEGLKEIHRRLLL